MPNIGAANIAKIRLAQQGGDPAVPAAGFWYLYIRSDGLYVEDESGAVTGPLVELGSAATQAAAGAHKSQHQNGGADEVATATPAANVIPKAGASGKLAIGFLASGTPDGTKFVRDDGTLAVPSGSGMSNPMDSAGDMIVGGIAGAAAKLDSGTSGYHLVAKGAASPAWEAQYSTINFVIDGGGSAITGGVKGDLVVDFACTIVSWTLLADTSGAIKIDVWVEHYADYPPTDADTICNAHEPEIPASGTKAQDTDLSDWIANPPAIEAGQTIRFNVDSCTDITRCTLALKVQRT